MTALIFFLAFLQPVPQPRTVFSGTLVDQDGFPIYRAFIALEPADEATAAIPTGWQGGMTDDRGAFRITGHHAGRYYVRLVTSNVPDIDRRYMAQYYAGDPSGGVLERARSQVITLVDGVEQTIEFHAAMYQGVAFSGRVIMPDGRTPMAAGLRGAGIRITPFEYGWTLWGDAAPNGQFRFPHVPPGKYVITAENHSDTKTGDFQGQTVVVSESGEARDVTLKMLEVKPMEVSGMVVVEDGSKPAPLTVTLYSGHGREFSVVTADNGSFVIKGVLPEFQYFVMIGPLRRADGNRAPLTVKPSPVSVTWNGREYSRGFGFEIAQTDAPQLRIVLARNTP